jgi:ABC-type uncharacterized transport system substrate-binding protein
MIRAATAGPRGSEGASGRLLCSCKPSVIGGAPLFRPSLWYFAPMNRHLHRLLLAVSLSVVSTAALAHPHVFVVMKTEFVYAPDGAVTGVRHAWTFEDMFSTYATQGIEQKVKGQFTRDELAPLADVNIQSLKEYDYFTQATADGKRIDFSDPKDHWLEFKDDTLTLHYVLPLKAPLKAKAVELEVYDPAYFVGFSFAPKDAVTLAGAPASCKATTAVPQGESSTSRLSEAFFNQPNAANIGAQFANKIAVKCP